MEANCELTRTFWATFAAWWQTLNSYFELVINFMSFTQWRANKILCECVTAELNGLFVSGCKVEKAVYELS